MHNFFGTMLKYSHIKFDKKRIQMKKISLFIIFITFAVSASSKNDFNKSFIKVSKEVNPAVVSIVSETVEKTTHQDFFFPPGFEHFFPEFRNFPERERRGQSLGSGVIIDSKNGYIVTNNHVVNNAEEIKVILFNKEELTAELVGTDPLSDIALLKVQSKTLKDVKMGDSDKLEVGEWVIAIGSPFGLHLNHTVTAGIVSAIGRSQVISKISFEDFIQHDAAINPGNSGGALVDLSGNLIGVNTAIATDGYSRSNAGVGFAIPVNMVKRIVDDLINGGDVRRGWLGVSIQDIDDNMAKALNLKNKVGAIINNILNNSPAEKAGLREKDVIIKVGNKKVENGTKLRNMVSNKRPGDIVRFRIIRNNKEQTIKVKLGERPAEKDLQAEYNIDSSFDIIGLKVANFENSKGVIITKIKKNSTAEKNSLMINDIITNIGDDSISDITEYKKYLNNYNEGDIILLRILRKNNVRYEAFEIK